uniref:Uncharacterized protein n=1 Tax=Oryza brachyantha TaxID=4533 RepID=J3MVW4_ORYBR
MVVSTIRNAIDSIGFGSHWRCFWNTGTQYVDAKDNILACVVKWLDHHQLADLARGMQPKLGRELERILHGPFEHAILQLHLFTDQVRYLRDKSSSTPDQSNQLDGGVESVETGMDICEKISSYMFYLLVVNPSMLPVSSTARDTLALFPKKVFSACKGINEIIERDWKIGGIEGKILLGVRALLDSTQAESFSAEMMSKLKEIWIRLVSR